MKDFYLVYQPKVCKDNIVGLEALIRPTDNSLNVEKFLESKPDKIDLDLAVVKECVREITENDINIPVSINIYPSSLECEFFVHFVIKTAKGKNVILELIEHEKANLTEQFLKHVNQIRSEDIQLSIDDFGKDFARADLALNLQVEQVKFDRSLIDGMEVNYFKYKHLAFLYSKITQLCTQNIVFEGVETKLQVDLINQFCKDAVIQGYYYFKPMRVEDIVKLKSRFEVKEKVVEPDLNCDFELKLFEFMISNPESQTVEAINEFIKKNDTLRLVYNENPQVTLDNYRKIYHSSSSVTSNGVLSLIDTTDKLVIMRNDEGTVIYDNDAHRNYIGKSLVGIPSSEIIAKYEAYQTCIDADKLILDNPDLSFQKSFEIFDGIKYETIREKMNFNNRTFIITTICPVESGLMESGYDELTGCYDRSFLRTSENSFSNRVVAFLDLNGFKTVNDEFGHHKGDECLVKFTKLLKNMSRAEDIIIRHGGDEFLVIFDTTNVDEIAQRLNNINYQVIIQFAKLGYDLSFSFGTALIGSEGINAAIIEADEKMYENKRLFKISQDLALTNTQVM